MRISDWSSDVCSSDLIERVQHDLAEGRQDADLYVAAGPRIMDLYRQRIESRQDSAADHTSGRRSDIIERDLRLAALKAERAEIFRRVRRRQLGPEIARKLVRDIALLEARTAGEAWRSEERRVGEEWE